MAELGEWQGVEQIVSGGQTGVDRAALDVALELDIPHGGWCPAGRRAEDGTLGEQYRLRETESPKYHVRTQRNVHESDGTLLLYRSPLSGGSELTRDLALRHGRPCLLVDLSPTSESPADSDVSSVRDWLTEEQIATLNVAGPRESTAPGIYEEAATFLRQLLASC